MCLGIPMRVIESDGFRALCERPGKGPGDPQGERRTVDLLLVGDQTPGTWLLVHLETARQVIDERTAALIDDALGALDAALAGEPIDGFFADLDREPELPAHLRSG